MSGIYDRATATANRLLAKNGRAWTFTSTDNAGAVTSRSAVGVFWKTVKSTLGDSGVAIGDKQFIFNAAAAPQIGDRMANGSESYVVKWFDPIGDTPAAFYVWARAG